MNIQHTDAILLRTRADHFLNTDSGTGPEVKMMKEASRDPNVSDEVWFIERINGNGPVQDGEPILLKTRAGYFLNTDHGTGPEVKMMKEASRDPNISDEVWFIESIHGNGSVQDGEPILLKTRADYFLNTDHGTGPEVKMMKEASRDPNISDEVWFIELINQNSESQPSFDKGKLIDSGSADVDVVSLDYKIYEHEIVVYPRIIGIRTGGEYFLRSGNNAITTTWPEADGLTRYQFKIWVVDKELWAEIEHQHKTVNIDLSTDWHRDSGAKTSLGSWSDLKI